MLIEHEIVFKHLFIVKINGPIIHVLLDITCINGVDRTSKMYDGISYRILKEGGSIEELYIYAVLNLL